MIVSLSASWFWIVWYGIMSRQYERGVGKANTQWVTENCKEWCGSQSLINKNSSTIYYKYQKHLSSQLLSTVIFMSVVSKNGHKSFSSNLQTCDFMQDLLHTSIIYNTHTIKFYSYWMTWSIINIYFLQSFLPKFHSHLSKTKITDLVLYFCYLNIKCSDSKCWCPTLAWQQQCTQEVFIVMLSVTETHSILQTYFLNINSFVSEPKSLTPLPQSPPLVQSLCQFNLVHIITDQF